jgi:hypothetical protein
MKNVLGRPYSTKSININMVYSSTNEPARWNIDNPKNVDSK